MSLSGAEDGTCLGALIDDTEATNWESAGSAIAGKAVTIDLAGTTPQELASMQVSALLFAGQNRRVVVLVALVVGRPRALVVEDHEPDVRSASGQVEPPDDELRCTGSWLDGREGIRGARERRRDVIGTGARGRPHRPADLDFELPEGGEPNVTDRSAGSVQDLTVRVAEVQVFGS